MKTTKKILAFVMILSLLFAMFSSGMSVSAAKYGEIERIPVLGKYVISTGESFELSRVFRNRETNNCTAEVMNKNYYTVSIAVDEETGDAQRIVADTKDCGVNLISVCEYFRHDGFNDFVEHYYIIIVVESGTVKVADMNEIYKVEMPDLKIKYKSKAFPEEIITVPNVDSDIYCAEVCFISSEDGKVFVDDDGYIYGGKTGSYDARLYVIDALGHVFSENFTVKVQYSLGQWLIRIFLFGWLWY